jgi:hypothetical protein
MRPMAPLIAPAFIGLWGSSSLAAFLSPEEAASHIGETGTVCGVVMSAKYGADAQRQPTLLDLGKPAPNAIFSAVIYGMDRAKFGTPETALLGKHICVEGSITYYRGKPEIVLTDPSQLTQ